jgi:hypothetical protein
MGMAVVGLRWLRMLLMRMAFVWKKLAEKES